MRILPGLLALACLALTACVNLRNGVIVQKCARTGQPEVYAEVTFHYTEPTVYWVRVQGLDTKGRQRTKNIILFRHDWDQLRVGDHWSRAGGFSPAEADK